MKVLALGGGGAKGAYQIGVLKGLLRDSNNCYDAICGVSVGALHVAILSQFDKIFQSIAVEFLEQTWVERVRSNTVCRYWQPFGVVQGLFKKSLYDSSPLRDLLNSLFDANTALQCGMDCAVGAVNVRTGRTIYVNQKHEKFLDFVIASASFPVFFPPVKIDGDFWFDGGVKEVTPLGQAVKMGATEVDLVITDSDVHGDKIRNDEFKRVFPDVLSRTIELMHHRMLKRDIEITLLKNKLSKVDDKYKFVKVNIYSPSIRLPDRILKFDKDEICTMIDLGYNDYKKKLNDL